MPVRLRSLSLLLLALHFAAFYAQAEPRTCASLAQLPLPNVSIESAQVVEAGSFIPPGSKPLNGLPAFCRVVGVLTPSTDSRIRFETWLPVHGWNGRYLGVGNGGFAGSIGYGALGENLRRGYATAGTDTGHQADGEDASWAYKHPEKIKDFGYRGLHETTLTAKAMANAFYGKDPGHSYFDACSDGGREALLEAQRFPTDFDGILAGAPANNWAYMLSAGIDVIGGMYGTPGAYISSLKLPAIAAAVRKQCDAADGVTDGVISNPAACHFDASVLACKGAENSSCLTTPQIQTLQLLYGKSSRSVAGKLFPGFAPGGEDDPNGWNTWITGHSPGGNSMTAYVTNYFRYMVFDDPRWEPLTANAATAAARAERKTGDALNAVNTDLSAFAARGGKLIMYHGWSDPAISPYNSIHYYEGVQKRLGSGASTRFLRLYMVPGMGHCLGGSGASYFGQLGTVTAKEPAHGIYDSLEAWVEKGTEPGQITATKWTGDEGKQSVSLTRPLCPYPSVPTYKGQGETNDASNFSCRVVQTEGSAAASAKP